MLKCGGSVKSWTRRYFVLLDSCLQYFKVSILCEPLSRRNTLSNQMDMACPALYLWLYLPFQRSNTPYFSLILRILLILIILLILLSMTIAITTTLFIIIMFIIRTKPTWNQRAR